MIDTHGKVVLVTGASSGIGACCVSRFSTAGFCVYAAARSIASQSEALLANGVQPVSLDVTDEEAVNRAIEEIVAREGRLDVVVNSAGIGIAGAIEDTSVAEAQEQFDVNFFGTLRVCRAVLPVMRRQRAGSIVNIGSIGGLIAIPFQGIYSASKFALEGLTESLRLEVRPYGIRVVLVEPGDHATSFTQNRLATAASGINPVYQERFTNAIGQMAHDEQNGPSPDKVAEVVLRILRAENPRLRYTVGPLPQRGAVWLKRLFPYALLERTMRRVYGC